MLRNQKTVWGSDFANKSTNAPSIRQGKCALSPLPLGKNVFAENSLRARTTNPATKRPLLDDALRTLNLFKSRKKRSNLRPTYQTVPSPYISQQLLRKKQNKKEEGKISTVGVSRSPAQELNLHTSFPLNKRKLTTPCNASLNLTGNVQNPLPASPSPLKSGPDLQKQRLPELHKQHRAGRTSKRKSKFVIPSVFPLLDTQHQLKNPELASIYLPSQQRTVGADGRIPRASMTNYAEKRNFQAKCVRPQGMAAMLAKYKQKYSKSLSGRYRIPGTQLLEGDRLAGGTSKGADNWQEKIRKNITSYISVLCSNKYKFVITKGNNSGIVRRAMEARPWWVELSTMSPAFNFLWQPFSQGINFSSLSDPSAKQLVNHFECHRELSRKSNLFLNLQEFAEQNHENVFDFLPLTFYVEITGSRPSAGLQHFVSVYQALDRGKATAFRFHRVPPGAREEQQSYHLPKQDGLYGKLVPSAYGATNGGAKFAKYTMPACHFVGHNLWILKPTGLNRGRGIHVFYELESLKEYVVSYCQAEKKGDPLASGFVLQKYIEDPLLIRGRKFDIRMWVLITSELDGYLFREGYLRTSSSQFSIDPNNVDDKFVHLTNNAVQKFSTTYGSFEDGNQMSFAQFQDYLSTIFRGQNIEFDKVILSQIKSLVMKSFLSVRRKLNPLRSRSTFELFGYDFIIDSDLNVWLIEVNTNPCLEESSALLKALLPRMVNDALKLTVDLVFPKPNDSDSGSGLTRKYPVKGYDDDYNMWELLVKSADRMLQVVSPCHTLRSEFVVSVNSKSGIKIQRQGGEIKPGATALKIEGPK